MIIAVNDINKAMGQDKAFICSATDAGYATVERNEDGSITVHKGHVQGFRMDLAPGEHFQYKDGWIRPEPRPWKSAFGQALEDLGLKVWQTMQFEPKITCPGELFTAPVEQRFIQDAGSATLGASGNHVTYDGWSLLAWEEDGQVYLMMHAKTPSKGLAEALTRLRAKDAFQALLTSDAELRRHVTRVEHLVKVLENSRDYVLGWVEVRRERRRKEQRGRVHVGGGHDTAKGRDTMASIGDMIPNLNLADAVIRKG